MNKSSNQPRSVKFKKYNLLLVNCCSKIPIAVTRVRRGGAIAKLESNNRNDKQLKSKKPAHSLRTIKRVPNFKKLHKQFEAHIARVSVINT